MNYSLDRRGIPLRQAYPRMWEGWGSLHPWAMRDREDTGVAMVTRNEFQVLAWDFASQLGFGRHTDPENELTE